MYNLEFSEESRQNLVDANQALSEHSLVIYVNHTSMVEDVGLPVTMVLSFLTNTKRIIGPVAMKHYDPARDPVNAVLLRMLKTIGIEIYPIVQSEDIDGNAAAYGVEKTQQLSTDVRNAMADAVTNPGTVFGITPEGTRSRDGRLIRAKKGIGYLANYDPEHTLYYLPVAIVLEKFSDHPSIRVGRPLRLDEMNLDLHTLPDDPRDRAQYLADVHMQRLADLLPREMRGEYG